MISKAPTYAVLHSYMGVTEIRYRRPRTDTGLAREVLARQREARRYGQRSPYSVSTKPEHVL